MKVYINREITGFDNLNALIEDSIKSREKFKATYNKETIRPTPPDDDGRNTAVDVVLTSGLLSVDAIAFYKRPDITIVPNGKKDPDPLLPVFIYDGPLSLIYDQSELVNFAKPLVSERLNIPMDSFRIENIETDRWMEGLIRFDITAYQYSEVIIGKTHGYIKAEIPKHIIYDLPGDYGLHAPELFAKDSKPLNKFGREAFFRNPPVTGIDNYKQLGNKDSEVHSSMINSYINKKYSSDQVDVYEITKPTQNTNKTSWTGVKIKGSTEYKYFGLYETRQFVPEEDFTNYIPPGRATKWYEEYENKLLINSNTNDIVFYAPRGIMGDSVTKKQAAEIQDNILKELFSTYGLPVDTITLHDEWLSQIPDAGTERPEYNIRYDNSAIVQNGPFTIKIIYEKSNKCLRIPFYDYIDNHNSIGAIEGISDGWSADGVAWWEIDAGNLRDDNNNPIIRPDTFTDSNGAWYYPPTGPGTAAPWYGSYTEAGGNQGQGGNNDNERKPVNNDKYTETPSNGNYTYTDLNTFGDPNLLGYKLSEQ